MINAEQIRAARALLDWSTADLAKQTGLTVNGINKIERGHVQAHRETVENLQQVFENAGVEFLPGSGIRKKDKIVEIYEGPERFDEFYDFLYTHLEKNGGDVCLSTGDETLLAGYRKNKELHRKRMRELVNERGDVTFRVLAAKSDFISHGYAQFKWQPQHNTGQTAFYAFGDCLALISFVSANPPYVVVIEATPLAKAYRQSFEIMWNNAKERPPGLTDKKGGQ